jgi:hypothetical protein
MEQNLSTLIGSDLYLFVQFVGCLLFAFIGSILKEIYNTNAIHGYAFGPHRVISSTIAASLSALFIKTHYFSEEYGWALIAFGSFILGLLGYEIFKNLCSIEGIYHLIERFRELMGVISGATDIPKNKQTDDSSDINNTCNDPSIPSNKIRIRKGPDDE